MPSRLHRSVATGAFRTALSPDFACAKSTTSGHPRRWEKGTPFARFETTKRTTCRMFPMGRDWVPATLRNDAPSDVLCIVLDGDIEAKPVPSDFRMLRPGGSSTECCRSIDAFGVYRAGRPVPVEFGSSNSPWWRISDGTHCRVVEGEGGVLLLEIIERLPHMPLPCPSTAEFWGYEEPSS